MTVGVSDGDRIGIVGRNGDGKSSLLGLLTGQSAPGFRTGDPAQRAAGRRAEPGGHPGLAQHGGMDAGRRPARTRVGRQSAHPRRGRRTGRRHHLGRDDRHAQRRPAAPGSAGRAAGRRLGRHRAGRADQSPRHRRHHLAGRSLAPALGPQYRRTAAGDPRPMVSRRGGDHDVGGARRHRRAVRGRLRRVRVAARRAGPAEPPSPRPSDRT